MHFLYMRFVLCILAGAGAVYATPRRACLPPWSAPLGDTGGMATCYNLLQAHVSLLPATAILSMLYKMYRFPFLFSMVEKGWREV